MGGDDCPNISELDQAISVVIGIVRWLGRFLTSFKEANSSAVRRGLFRNEEDKWFLIRQICGVLTWVDSQSSDQGNGGSVG